MSEYQRLLLIADPQMRHSPALQRAAALAQATGAALHILALVEPFATLPLLDKSIQEQTREAYLQERRDWLRDEVGLLQSKGIQVTAEALWTRQQLKEILLHAAEMPADLLIKDLQHEPALKRAFITPLDWQLLRECPVPVHLVSAAENPLPLKIGAAVDPTAPEDERNALNSRIIAAANGLALQCNAQLHLLHAYDLSPAFLAEAGTATAVCVDMLDELRQSLAVAFAELAERYGVPAERRHFIMGPPTRTLAEFAGREGLDVLVMGRVQRKGLDKLLGSTTEHMLYQVPCSVLAIAL